MADVANVIIPVITGFLGYLLKVAEDWWKGYQHEQKQQQDAWLRHRQRYYWPLLQSARRLCDRLDHLRRIYFDPSFGGFESLSQDFRELFVLARAPITDLDHVRPDRPRKSEGAAQHLRTRMSHDLNFATSTLYRTARYLALAWSTRIHLAGGQHGLPDAAIAKLNERLDAVSSGLQGRIFGPNRCVPADVQDSIGEFMTTSANQVMGQYEFRKRLLEVPGWEQFTALFKLFLTAGPPDSASLFDKIPREIRATVRTLHDLCNVLEYVTDLEWPSDYRSECVSAPVRDPWPGFLPVPIDMLPAE